MMRQINLFNPALLPQKQQFSAGTMLQAMGVIVLVLLGFVWFGQWQLSHLQKQSSANAKQLTSLRAQLEKLNASMPPREKSLRLVQDLSKAEQQLQGLQEVQGWLQSGSFGNSVGYASYMSALARQTVPGLWLTGFSFGGPGQSLALNGRVMQADLLPQFVQALSKEPSFHGKSFDGLEIWQGELDEKAKRALRNKRESESKLASKPDAKLEGKPDAGEDKEFDKPPYLEFSLKGEATVGGKSLASPTSNATASSASVAQGGAK